MLSESLVSLLVKELEIHDFAQQAYAGERYVATSMAASVPGRRQHGQGLAQECRKTCWSPGQGEHAQAPSHVLFAPRHAGCSGQAIQELAGHADLSMTMRYMHLAVGTLDSAIRLLDQPVPEFGDIVETGRSRNEG
jgi:hypothetical protein